MSDFSWPKSDVRKYENEIYCILQSFEKAQEWADLSNCLQRLNRCIGKEFSDIPGVPLKEIVSKRLAQCLNPSLPSGVHTKALEAYGGIFEKIGKNELSSDLALYGSGLFPFFVHSSTQVKPIFLDLVDKYFLPLGPGLLPCLSGLLVGLLPGLENSKSECYERIIKTFQSISSEDCVGEKNFMCTLWLVILRTSQVRYTALEVIMTRFSAISTLSNGNYCQKIQNLIPCNILFVKALESCIEDDNILVKRYLLDFLISHVPINQKTNYISDYNYIEKILPFKHKVNLLRKALSLFLLKEWSLTRRLIQWITNDKSFCSEKNYENKIDDEMLQTLVTAVIEDFILSISLFNLNFENENDSNSLRYQSINNSKNINGLQQSYNSTNKSSILHPIKMLSALFEEFTLCINFIAPKILILLLAYIRESSLKFPELKDSIIEESTCLINSYSLDLNIFLDTVNSSFMNLLNSTKIISNDKKNNSTITNITFPLLKEVILFYIDNFLQNEEIENKDRHLESFFLNLTIIIANIMVDIKPENKEMVILFELCIHCMKNLKSMKEKSKLPDTSVNSLKLFIEFISAFLYENTFTKEEIVLRNLLYEALSNLFEIKIFNEIFIQTDLSDSPTPNEKLPIPSWLYKLFKRMIELNITEENSYLKLENYHIEDAFKCIRIIIKLLFNSYFFSKIELASACLAECVDKITKMLWDFLSPGLFRYHEEATNLLIDLEKWAKLNSSYMSNFGMFNQSQLIREASILNYLFINQLSTLNIELKINNIKKLSIFMKYSINSIYKIPAEVTFLILEGLDSNLIQLRLSCSIWIVQTLETPKLILNHLLNDLLWSELALSGNNLVSYNENLDFARIIYSLERLTALISMENINIIQVLFDTNIDKSETLYNSFQYQILNYFDAFILICLSLFTNITNNNDFRVNCTAINSLNFILKKSLFYNNYNSSKRSSKFENKLIILLSHITDSILEALQESISAKKYPLQTPIIQLLHTILLIQRQYKSIVHEIKAPTLVSSNNKLFTILISGIQQITNIISNDEHVEINKNDCFIFPTNFLSISSYSSLIKPYINFSLSIFEDLDQETLIHDVKSIILCLCMELIVSLFNKNYLAIVQYLDSILIVMQNAIGIFPISNTLCESRPSNLHNTGFIYSFFSSQKSHSNKNFNIEFNSLSSTPQLIKNTIESIDSITKTSKSNILKKTVLILFSALIESFNFVHENSSSKEDDQNLKLLCSQILYYIDSIAFIIAWNASDAFIFSGIVCWTHVNNHKIKTKSSSSLNQITVDGDLRSTSIISIFQLNSLREFISPSAIFSVIGDFLSYFWLYSDSNSFNETKLDHNSEVEDSKIPNYVLSFSKTYLDKDWIDCYGHWKETFVYHFLYTLLVTSQFSNGPMEFLKIWEIISVLLNLFLQNTKQPKSILWFATILSTLDASMASFKDAPSSFFLDKKLSSIFEDKKMIKNLSNLIYMILLLVQENFSTKVSGVHSQQFDKLPPLPPTIEAILQSIKFDFTNESQLPCEIANIQGNCPKTIVSDDPSLLFSYYSMGFLIMYNTEVALHKNNKRLFLRNIWCSCIVKSLDWIFQPLLKRNNNVTNMIHKYFLLLHIDTFPFRIFPDYLLGIKKPVIEALNSPNFFCVDRRTFRCWINIVSKLVSYDTTSLSAVGRVNILETYVSLQSMGIFSTKSAELQNRCNHIKRLAFLIFCCPQNTFQLQLSIILEKLVENLKLAPEYLIDSDSNIGLHFVYLAEQVILCLRVLLLKVHYQSLMPLWPIVLAELIKIFRLKDHKRLKVSAMKFVDLASLLDIPEFHLYQWIFVTDFFDTKSSAKEIDDLEIVGNSKTNNILFSPFCNLPDVNEGIDQSVLGIDMKTLNQSFNTETPKFPLIHQRNKTEFNDNFIEMASQLNNNCLLNSIKTSKIDYEKLIRSIENDFLDFPDNLLDWSSGCDLHSLYNMIMSQKSSLKLNCSKFSII